MILLDTGPVIALFDPRDADHGLAKETLRGLTEPLVTTAPVLTEAFHLLGPESRGSSALRRFIERGGCAVHPIDEALLVRCFALMDKYVDRPMDLADASLVAVAEALRETTVLTFDRADFSTYRVRIGKAYKRFRVLPEA
jgi:predicted nucleic acid-binding protein